MIKFIQNFYRKNFCPETTVLLCELFDQCPQLDRAIVFVESTPLTGNRIIYEWHDYPEIAQLVVRKHEIQKKAKSIVVEKKLSRLDFQAVFDFVQKASDSIGNYSGRVKDGVFYSLCWGSPSRQHVLNIKNPQAGSEAHQKFINVLKSFTVEA